VIDTTTTDLRALVDRLEALAERRLAQRPRSQAAADRASQLADHLHGHVRVRAASLDAPLVVLLVGPTGGGKSTIFNTIAGRVRSETGVLRPTTRRAIVLLNPADREALVEGGLSGFEPDQLRFVEDAGLEPGLALIDAPDIDSIEDANRALAGRLVEAADLCCFVTTATRYADRVPWAVLARVRERGVPLMVVVNRLPAEADDRAQVLGDIRRLMSDAGLDAQRAGPDGAAPIELVAIREGDVDARGERLLPSTIDPLTSEIERLRADRSARVELAARALGGSLGGLSETLERIADDAEHEAIDVEALRRLADRSYENGLVALRQEISQGSFLREEALRHWQSFVGADQMTRLFSDGIGRIRGALAAAFRPATAPVTEIRAATTEDLVAAARLEAAEAARRTATAWCDDPGLGRIVAEDPGLWLPSGDFDARLGARIEGWIDGIVTEIQERGRPKRTLARGASIGVNVLGTGVMLASFLHTGGLTGAEVGVAAATAFLNQKLLSALFGEAAMVELVANARQRLQDALAATFAEERARYDGLLPAAGDLPDLATELRDAAGTVRTLRPVTA
jgi:energy-coupling factor transporter ATP-binding protein EcfA2